MLEIVFVKILSVVPLSVSSMKITIHRILSLHPPLPTSHPFLCRLITAVVLIIDSKVTILNSFIAFHPTCKTLDSNVLLQTHFCLDDNELNVFEMKFIVFSSSLLLKLDYPNVNSSLSVYF